MNLWKIDPLLELFRQAGQTALRSYPDAPAELKKDHSEVTAADREIEQMMASRFDHPEQGVFMIGEESVATKSEAYLAQALSGSCFVVDPIDGTAPYVAGVPLWGISVGLLQSGILTEGAVYYPAFDEGFLSCRGTLFRFEKLLSGAPEIAPYQPAMPEYTPAIPICVGQQLLRSSIPAFPNQIFAWSSCTACFRAMLHGKVYAYIHRSKLWDVAGGLPLLRAAGFMLCDEDGRELDFNIAAGRDFQLEASPQRWRQKKFAILAPSLEAAERLRSQLKVTKQP